MCVFWYVSYCLCSIYASFPSFWKLYLSQYKPLHKCSKICFCFVILSTVHTYFVFFLKLVDLLVYLGCNISSSESDANLRIGKSWTAIDRLLTSRISDQSNKIIIPSRSHISTTAWLHYNKKTIEKARGEPRTDASCCFEHILEAEPHKTTTGWPHTSHLKNYPSKTSKLNTVDKVMTNS